MTSAHDIGANQIGALDIGALGRRAEAMIAALGQVSSEPNRLVRLFLTPEHRRAADLVAGWMGEAGLAVSEDALGTVRGRSGEGRRLLIGSHIDTVIDAGRYDGPLGVIAGIIAADEARKRGCGQPIDVLAFGDEEGSRFPATLTSSSACAGVFDSKVLTLKDRAGITIADAIKSYGKDPGAIPGAAYRPAEVAGYVEVHIEQGPRLEAAEEPLADVEGIVGQSRLQVVLTGEAGHAGTVPMPLRRDALAGAAEITLAVESIARGYAGMVGTVGRLVADPGATNIIAGKATFSIDLRCMSDDDRRAALRRIEAEADAVAGRRKLNIAIDHLLDIAAMRCDAGLQTIIRDAIADVGGRALVLPSGAGHDAQVMARLCPSSMIFVRCRGGISHNPAEYASPHDMGLAVAALIRFIERFAAQS